MRVCTHTGFCLSVHPGDGRRIFAKEFGSICHDALMDKVAKCNLDDCYVGPWLTTLEDVN